MLSTSIFPLPLKLSAAVIRALQQNTAVLALESTVFTHGLPYPENLEALAMLEQAALDNGATPATICLLDGVYHIGLEAADLAKISTKLKHAEPLEKLAHRDLALAVARKASGGTTVSATMYLAYLTGIRVFSTGGIGGVHRGWQQSRDISLDIKALATIPTLVVCAGCKAILDIPATMEALESAGVPVYGWQTDEFPSFYSRQSGVKVNSIPDLKAIAEAFRIHSSLPIIGSGMLIANPIPPECEIPLQEIEPFIEQAIAEAKGISGKELTPHLLAKLAQITNNKSVKANLALLKNNVILGAKIAGALVKIYISVDMEGIPGTFNWEHEKVDRTSVRKCMMDHVGAALDEILNSPNADDIQEITIADSHSNGDNLFYQITARDERITLISGSPRPEYMMPGFDGSYDMVMLLGYHAGTGAVHANMDHTYSNSRIQQICINGKAMSEALINAAYAGYHKVPVVLVSGDLALRQELLPELPWLHYVTTKEGIAKFAAKNYSALKVEKDLRKAVQAAMGAEYVKLYHFDSPIELKIEFHSTAMTDVVCLMPGVVRLDGKTILYVHEDYAVMFNALMALITLAYACGI